MRSSGRVRFILPLALIVFAGISFALLVWLSVDQKGKENNSLINNTNIVSNLKANNNINSSQNTNQSSGKCATSGCSGQVCAAEGEDIYTTCEIQDWFECLALTKCERQKNGQCGWSENKAYLNCLKEKKK